MDGDKTLLQQIRCVTVLSMAIKYNTSLLFTRSSQICLQSVMENTVQYYLSYLTIPVEYIRFDNLGLYLLFLCLIHSTVDYTNWRRLLEIATRPTTNYIALLSLFLPPPSFYTIFIQIVVNRLTKLTPADYTYLLRVLSFLPVARQYAFARFCWRVYPSCERITCRVSSYLQEEITQEVRNGNSPNIASFMKNTKQ